MDRHHPIKDDEVEILGQAKVERILPVTGDNDIVTEFGQATFDERRRVDIVFSEKDAHPRVELVSFASSFQAVFDDLAGHGIDTDFVVLAVLADVERPTPAAAFFFVV